jgi:hypothetical protein
MIKKILPIALWLIAAVTVLGQNAVMVNRSNSIITYPLNFWTANALAGRSGLGFNTNLNTFWAATNAAAARTAIGALATNGNGSALTNLTASNITGTLAISNGGSGATTAGGARTNLGLGATNDVEFQTVKINLSTGAGDSLIVTNSGSSATSLFDDITVNELDAETAAFGSTVIVSSNGISFNTNTAAATTRTNLGLGASSSVAFSSLTLSNGAQTNLSINLGSTNRGFYATTGPDRVVTVVSGINALQVFSNSVETAIGIALSVSGAGSFGTNLQIGGPLSFSGTNAAGNAGATRTNLSLGWVALTNSNAGTALVSVNTNGEVVSPTNFWQVAPITTTFIESEPLTNSSTNISGGRFLHIHSLAPAIGGVTNTIVLPTNGTTFVGDVALIVHQGPTNSLTKVRTSGSTNDLVTMSRFDETVEFVYYNDVWQFNHNQSFVEPIYFSGTNAAANRAASRTNLGLGITNLVQFAYVESPYFFVSDSTNGIRFETPDVAAITRTNLGIGSGATNTVSFGKIRVPTGYLIIEDPANDASIITFPVDTDPVVLGADYWNHDSVRASLGLGTADAVTFQSLIADQLQVLVGTNIYVNLAEDVSEFYVPLQLENELAVVGAATFSTNVTVGGALTVTSTVTAKTNLVVEGFVDYTAARTNNTPTNTPNFAAHAAWIEVKVGTNSFFLPAYQ